MIRIMSAFILAMLSALCAAADPDIQLADGAPGRHVVLPGDTLWGLSTTFLKDPWRWSEIWQMNREQIRSPHRIYPGDVILLERDLQGRPRLRLQSAKLAPQVHVEKNPQAIPTIAPNVIRPFLSEPLIVEADSLDRSARIVAAQEDRVNLGNGDRAYVIGAEPATENWQVFRNGKPLLDPVNKEVLGYEAFYLGTAKQRQPGEPATFEIISAKEEISRGDRLVPAVRPTLIAYAPHKPDAVIEGRVLSVYGGVGVGGQGSVVAINRGTRDGLEIGHVLTLERNRVVVQRDENDQKESVIIPPHRGGYLFIFRTFERISYALVATAEGVVEVNDFVRTP
ncbi:MAG TPA: LysM peptidoglycan-binding domain-containing protein [Accumulibacter sp.]|jgi:hypothetical protein|nr:LysM peptidoglycan-binding domain-containing protein [Accumulibacter sp.]